MSSVDDKEDENDNQSTKTNDWEGFRKELVNHIRNVVVVVIVGGLFLVHVGGNLFLSDDDISNLKKNDPKLYEVVKNVESTPFSAIDPTKAPYTHVNSNELDDAFFTTQKWTFPYKNFFNEKLDWEFKKDNWDTAKPVLHTCGVQLEKMFSGSYSTGRWLLESLRNFGNKQGKAYKKVGKGLMPTLLFWFFGVIVSLFLYYGIWHYAIFSIIVYSVINFIFNTLKIFNIPDPPVKKTPAEIEMEKAMKKATQSGGQAALPDTTANAAAAGTQTTQAANPSAGQGVGIFGDAEAVKALGEASVKVAKEADNIVDKNVDKAATYPADLLKKTGAAAAASSAVIAIKDAVMGIIYAIFWFFKRLFKTIFLLIFTYIATGLGCLINAIWQPAMFIGWFLGPLFDDAERKVLFQYMGKQKYIVAFAIYLSILSSCYNNLHSWNPTYMAVAGIIVLIMAIFGVIQ